VNRRHNDQPCPQCFAVVCAALIFWWIVIHLLECIK